MMPKNTTADFLASFTKTETCWIWNKSLVTSGYGRFSFNHKTIRAHRFSYELFKGPIPAGLFVCHTCDNRSCVNPDHLFIGTARDNTWDMFNKGRQNRVKGSRHGRSKLSEAEVVKIRSIYAFGGRTMQSIATEFNVSRRAIGFIIKRKNWQHI